jgi:hypothetical protein
MQKPGGYNVQQQGELLSILSGFVMDKIEINRLLCMLGATAQRFCVVDGNEYFEQLKYVLENFTEKGEVVRWIEKMYEEVTNEECLTDMENDYSEYEDGESDGDWDDYDY